MGLQHFVKVVILNPDGDRPMMRAVCFHCHRALTTAIKPRKEFNQFSDYQRYLKGKDREIRDVFGPNPDAIRQN